MTYPVPQPSPSGRGNTSPRPLGEKARVGEKPMRKFRLQDVVTIGCNFPPHTILMKMRTTAWIIPEPIEVRLGRFPTAKKT